MRVRVYETCEADTPPKKRFTGVIEWQGHKNNWHITTFVFGPTEEEARRKGQEFIENEVNPSAKRKAPIEADSLVPVEDDETV